MHLKKALMNVKKYHEFGNHRLKRTVEEKIPFF